LIFLGVIYIIWKSRFGDKENTAPQPCVDGASMSNVMVGGDRRRNSKGTLSPSALEHIERSQKFRDRARMCVVGGPKFKVYKKPKPISKPSRYALPLSNLDDRFDCESGNSFDDRTMEDTSRSQSASEQEHRSSQGSIQYTVVQEE